MWYGCHHARGRWPVKRRVCQRVKPDNFLRPGVNIFHVFTHQRGIAGVPSITQDDHDGLFINDARAILLYELLQALTDPGSSAPGTALCTQERQRFFEFPLLQKSGLFSTIRKPE